MQYAHHLFDTNINFETLSVSPQFAVNSPPLVSIVTEQCVGGNGDDLPHYGKAPKRRARARDLKCGPEGTCSLGLAGRRMTDFTSENDEHSNAAQCA